MPSLSEAKSLVIPGIMACLACTPIIIGGYPYGHDWLYELVRIIEYREAILSGQGIPFWGGDLYHGFGSPIFIFYAPLYAASSALLMFGGVSVTTAAIAVLVLFAIAGSIGMFVLARELIGWKKAGAEKAAWVASAAFVFSPYFLADMLIRNASAEFTALCLAPYPFWGMALFFRCDRKGLAVLAGSFALVILSHNLTALVMAASLLLTAVVCFLLRHEYLKFIHTMAAMLIALGLSAWFWLPALGLTSYVHIDEMILGKFDFHKNFRSLSEIFRYGRLFSIDRIPPLTLLLCGGTLLRKKGSPLLQALFWGGILLIFLQTPSSTLVWENLPLLPLFQFPWRFLGPLSFIIALISGLLFHRYLARWPFAEMVAVLLVIANAWPILYSYRPLPDEFASETLTPRVITAQGLSATALDEYLPRTATKRTSDNIATSSPVIRTMGDVETAAALYSVSNRIQLEIESSGKGELHLARWHFPGWRAELNGNPLPLSPAGDGVIRASIPEGKYQMNLQLLQPPIRKFGFIISSISLVFAILLFRHRPQSQVLEIPILLDSILLKGQPPSKEEK